MHREKPKEIIITENSIKFRKIFFLIIGISTILGYFVLMFLQLITNGSISNGINFSSDLFLQILVLVSVGLLGIIYLHLLPKVRKVKEPFHRFGLHIIIFIMGVESFGLFGLFFGLIQLYLGNGNIDWLVVSFFFGLAVVDAVILYLTEINPTLNACEIGKSIPAFPPEEEQKADTN